VKRWGWNDIGNAATEYSAFREL
jgi:hypothetical protein